MALDLWVLGFHQCEPTLDLTNEPSWLFPLAVDLWCAAAVGQKDSPA